MYVKKFSHQIEQQLREFPRQKQRRPKSRSQLSYGGQAEVSQGLMRPKK